MEVLDQFGWDKQQGVKGSYCLQGYRYRLVYQECVEVRFRVWLACQFGLWVMIIIVLFFRLEIQFIICVLCFVFIVEVVLFKSKSGWFSSRVLVSVRCCCLFLDSFWIGCFSCLGCSLKWLKWFSIVCFEKFVC